MPRALAVYVRYMESFNIRLGAGLRIVILGLIGIILFEIISRFAFDSPHVWAMEMEKFIVGAYFLLASAYVLIRGGHVRMDAFYSKWSPRRRAIFDIATFSLMLIYLVTFIRGGIDDISYTIRYGQHTASMWGPHLAPIKFIILAGGVLLLLEGIAVFIRDIATVRGRSIE